MAPPGHPYEKFLQAPLSVPTLLVPEQMCVCVHMYVCRYVGWMCVCVGACMSVQFNVLREMCDRALQTHAYMSVKAELEKDGRQWRAWWS